MVKYISPIYEKAAIDTVDVICNSPTVSTYVDDNGNVVQEIDYNFGNIFKKLDKSLF